MVNKRVNEICFFRYSLDRTVWDSDVNALFHSKGSRYHLPALPSWQESWLV
jgi:catechol-2,3-dioxygenase